jgi:hypothetical protein
MKKKTTTKRKKVRPPMVPKELRPYIIRKFKTKNRSHRYLALRLANDVGFAVLVVSRNAPQIKTVRDFRTTKKQSEIPTPIQMVVNRELAVWWARHIARNLQPPSTKKERSKRKRLTRKAMRSYQAHLTTKSVVDKLKGRTVPLLKKPSVLMPYICIYNPMARRHDAVFHLHTAYCSRLDQERRKMLKRGGTSWVIEAKTANEAMALQLEEFMEDDKGYVGEDFEIHRCRGEGDDHKASACPKPKIARNRKSKAADAVGEERGHDRSSQVGVSPTGGQGLHSAGAIQSEPRS